MLEFVKFLSRILPTKIWLGIKFYLNKNLSQFTVSFPFKILMNIVPSDSITNAFGSIKVCSLEQRRLEMDLYDDFLDLSESVSSKYGA